MLKHLHTTLYLVFCTVFVACSAQNADKNHPEINFVSTFTQSQLFENYQQKKKLLIICDDDSLLHFMQNYTASIKNFRDEIQYEILSASQVNDTMLASNALYVIATEHTNSIFSKFNSKLPFSQDEKSFSFNNKTYTSEKDMLQVSFFPNPANDSLPATFITGNSNATILAHLKLLTKKEWGNIFWESWGYQVYEDGKRTVLGNFSTDSSTLWQIDKKLHWEFDYKGKIIEDSEKIQFIDHASGLTQFQFDSIIQLITTNLGRTEYECGGAISEKIYFHLYPTTETKGLMFNNTDQVHVNFETQEVHAVFNPDFKKNYPATECELAVRQILGKPQVDALEKGLALQSKMSWGAKGCKEWAFRLMAAQVFPSLEEILTNDDFHEQSSLIMSCAAAMLVEFLNQKLLPGNFHKQYTSLTKEQILAWKNDWLSFLSHCEIPPAEQRQYSIKTPVQGFNFAHEGYQIYNGYGGSAATHAIEQMKNIGTNSVSIIPYTGFREVNKPARFRFSNGAGGENDEAVIHSMYEAKKNGFTVMLKPQVWGWQAWPGDIQMHNENDWKLFFEYYTDWIMHYAMLAEMYEVDIFCAGVEFQMATTTHEDAWRTIFSKIRKVYTGKLTYASNWGYEFDNLTFWDDLDFMSINCYYPLSDKQNPTDEELVSNFETVLTHIEERQKIFQKPFLFTEIGFKSIDFPWLQPHADNDEQNMNETSQKRCYEAMFSAMEDETWISGIYLWQWPTYMSYIEENPKGFTPCGKEAEDVVKKYFLKP